MNVPAGISTISKGLASAGRLGRGIVMVWGNSGIGVGVLVGVRVDVGDAAGTGEGVGVGFGEDNVLESTTRRPW